MLFAQLFLLSSRQETYRQTRLSKGYNPGANTAITDFFFSTPWPGLLVPRSLQAGLKLGSCSLWTLCKLCGWSYHLKLVRDGAGGGCWWWVGTRQPAHQFSQRPTTAACQAHHLVQGYRSS